MFWLCLLFLARSVTARIGFSVDSDLHEKSLHRIGSRWCKNHVELDLYVFVSVQFFLFSFRMNLLSVQKHWVRYYMVRQSYKIGSMLHVKLDLNVLIQFYISRFDYRWIGSDLQRSGQSRRWAWAFPSQLALRARSLRCALVVHARGLRVLAASAKKYMNSYMITAKNIQIHTRYEFIFVWIHIFKVQKIYEFIHGAPQITYEDPIPSH